MNDEQYEQYTFPDWIFSILVIIGAFAAFFIALVYSL